MKFLLVFLAMFIGCSGSSDREEAISKLRTLGANATPSYVFQKDAPAQPVSIDFYLAIPKGHEITASQLDLSNSGTLFFNVVPDLGSITYQEVGDLRVAKITAQGVLPPVVSGIEYRGVSSVTIKYGLTVQDGSEVENIVGSVLIFKDGATVKNKGLKVSLKPLAEYTAKQESDVSADLVNAGGERFKIGWFVSSGEILNRRALSTKWKPAKSGAQAVIVTARGLDTGEFTMDFKESSVR
jgi:hypothetical protein